MTLYQSLRQELSEVRRKMIEAHGTADHFRYKLMAREIEMEMRQLWHQLSAS